MRNDVLRDLVQYKFNYNEETGWLTWKNCKYKKKNGKRVGSLNKLTGYKHIQINGKGYLEHIIIWLWFYGVLPDYDIDHINRIKDDNKIINLRETNHSCNMKNIGLKSNNKTDITGVRKNGSAFISNNKNKLIWLGVGITLLESAKLRYIGELKHNYLNCNDNSSAYNYILKHDSQWFSTNLEVQFIKETSIKIKNRSRLTQTQINKINSKFDNYKVELNEIKGKILNA